MIDIGKLYCFCTSSGEATAFGEDATARLPVKEPGLQLLPPSASQRKPVVYWNSTRACQADFPHSDTHSRGPESGRELTTDEAQLMFRDLARFGVPVLVLAGGEPLLRSDLLELIAYAQGDGIRPVLWTNGLLINHALAVRLKRAGTAHVVVSLDGVGAANGRRRGVKALWEEVLPGLRHCREAGLRLGVRLTLTQRNLRNLQNFFDFFETERIDRVLLCHAVGAGRASRRPSDGPSHQETRQAMDLILERTAAMQQRGFPIQVFTAHNHVDGVYIYLKLRKKDPVRAAEVYRLLKLEGGGRFGSGVGLGSIDAEGDVHPDPFWTHYTFGNVRERPFGEIWQDLSDPLMAGLKDHLPRLKGRCAHCLFQGLCGGNLRVRADLAYGDPWMPDPACYLSDEELSREIPPRRDVLEKHVQLEEKAA